MKRPLLLLLLLFPCISLAAKEVLRAFAPLQLDGMEPAVADALQRAQSAFDTVSPNPPKPAGQREPLAQRYAAIGHLYHAHELWDWAEAAYDNAQLLDPDNAAWRHAGAVVAFKRGEPGRAREQFEQLLESDTDALSARAYLAEIALQQGHGAVALDHVNAILAQRASAWARATAGRALQMLERPQEAAAQFAAALTLAPEANRLHYPLGMALRASGQTAQALQHLDQAGSVGLRLPDPLDASVAAARAGTRNLLLDGERALRAERPQDALHAYQLAVSADPALAEAHAGLAVAQAAVGDIRAARDSLLLALQRDPELLEARRNLARTELHLGNRQAALTQLEILLRGSPDDASLLQLQGRAALAEGQVETGLDSLRRALQQAPQDAGLRFGLAAALVNAGQLAAARDELQQGLLLQPQDLALRRALVRILAAAPQPELRDGARAVALIEPLAQQHRSASDMHLLAQALGESGRCREAADIYAQMATDDPSPQRAQAWRERASRAQLGECRPPTAPDRVFD